MQVNRRLYRCREDRVLAGVAAGVAEYFGLDPTLVRVLWLLSIFFGGVSLVIYIGLAIIMPLEPATGHEPRTDATPEADGHRHVTGRGGGLITFFGFVLILLGGIGLVELVLPGSVSWRHLWPALLLGIGGLLVARSIRRKPSGS
jgi:phage shock protein C